MVFLLLCCYDRYITASTAKCVLFSCIFLRRLTHTLKFEDFARREKLMSSSIVRNREVEEKQRLRSGRSGAGVTAHRESLGGILQTLQGSFSAVSKPNFASKYSFESSRRDLHDTLLCTALKSHFLPKICQNFAKIC